MKSSFKATINSLQGTMIVDIWNGQSITTHGTHQLRVICADFCMKTAAEEGTLLTLKSGGLRVENAKTNMFQSCSQTNQRLMLNCDCISMIYGQ